ncbi:MAG: serine hydrolase domain-containing protein [Spirosomataceae bacterium]
MKYSKNLITYLLLVVLFSTNAFSQVTDKVIGGMSVERLSSYENYIKSAIDEGKIPGAVSMIVRNGELVHHKAFGVSNVNTKTPMTTDGRFYIQSMTKPSITVAFMMLYEEGHFLLTEPVSKYIPAFKDLKVAKSVTVGKEGETEPMKNEITIANLLSHTAGLSHGLGGTALDKDYAMTMYFQPHKTVEDRMNAMLTLPLMGQPGEQWYYSAAPDVLSVLIEKFSGMSTADFIQKRIFEPLVMKHTGYNIPKAEQANMVYVHNKNKAGELEYSTNQPKMEGNTIWSGVNGLYATASDYMTFCQMLLNKGELNGKRLLSRKTVELMTMNHVGDLYNGAGEGFGLGFAVVENVAETKLLGSEGIFYWSGANNTHFFIDPKENLIAVFMTQLAPYDGEYHKRLRQHVIQAVVD